MMCTNCVTSDKLLNLSEPLRPHLTIEMGWEGLWHHNLVSAAFFTEYRCRPVLHLLWQMGDKDNLQTASGIFSLNY